MTAESTPGDGAHNASTATILDDPNLMFAETLREQFPLQWMLFQQSYSLSVQQVFCDSGSMIAAWNRVALDLIEQDQSSLSLLAANEPGGLFIAARAVADGLNTYGHQADLHIAHPIATLVPLIYKLLDELGPNLRKRLIAYAQAENLDEKLQETAVKLLIRFGDPSDLNDLVAVYKLDFSGEPMDSQTLSRLQVLPNLRELTMRRAHLSFSALQSLHACSELEVLDVSQTNVGNGSMVALASLPRLHTLNISETLVDDEAFDYLVKMTHLRSICTIGSILSDERTKDLSYLLPESSVISKPFEDDEFETWTNAPKVMYSLLRVVENYGALQRLEVPEGWQEKHEARRMMQGAGAGARSFHPREAGKVGLFVRTPSVPVSQFARNNWMRIVTQQPPRHLSEQDAEDLRLIFESAADPRYFEMTSLRTEDWNGRRVITMSGIWTSNLWEIFSIFVDAAGDGSQIQQIFFGAPIALFRTYLTEASRAMSQIKWNNPER